MELEKNAIEEEFKNKGIDNKDQVERSLTGLTSKAEQNMENMVRNQILNMHDANNETSYASSSMSEDFNDLKRISSNGK